MLWLTLGGLISLISGLVFLKFTKATFIGVVFAILGAILAVVMGVSTVKEDARNAAKCASAAGSYGGDVCYVSGVEKDLKEIGL